MYDKVGEWLNRRKLLNMVISVKADNKAGMQQWKIERLKWNRHFSLVMQGWDDP